ncbi:MAG: tetratricopeptide repeat-containing glycosyltransferase family protein [Rhodospirillales bacterium]
MARKPKIVSRKPAPKPAASTAQPAAAPAEKPAPVKTAAPAPAPAATDDATAIRDREAARVFALAVDYHRRALYDDAVRAYSRALSLDPLNPDVYNNLGVALRSQGKIAAAIACYQRGLVLRPNHTGTLANLGNALREQGNLKSALTALSHAVRQAPGSADVIHNLGLASRDSGDFDAAIKCFESAIAINGDAAAAHFDYGQTLLAQRDYDRGFREYEWRRKLPAYAIRSVDAPEWDGRELGGKTIVILGEGSSGDVLQFARYIPKVKERGGNVIVECHAALARIMANVSGVDRVVMSGSRGPDCDAFAPIMSLPKILGMTKTVDDSTVPYISPPDAVSVQLPPAPRNQLRVGLAWAPANPGTGRNERLCPLPDLLALLAIPGFTGFSLQTGESRKDLEEHSCDVLLPDLGSRINDVSDLAAMIRQLDLVICVDSVTAHIAGAMDKPVWLLAPRVADWRWGYEGETSPWYPNMRIFRQPAFGDWKSAIASVSEALRERIGARFGDGG